ncbi:hypothetical protein [Cereibacter sphaeroides]|uniref:hypothetical protein n=1 Tax=Cereibacter sphaeroides TaxID=1063 RepID=UPI0015F7BA5E|nr:hypothetical protein [Cereibacter sphaeroides]
MSSLGATPAAAARPTAIDGPASCLPCRPISGATCGPAPITVTLPPLGRRELLGLLREAMLAERVRRMSLRQRKAASICSSRAREITHEILALGPKA